MTAGERVVPKIGGGAFLRPVAPPCFPGTEVEEVPVVSLDDGGGLTMEPLGFGRFRG